MRMRCSYNGDKPLSYYTKSLEPSSEKIVLATIEAVERVKLFTLSGSDYAKVVDNIVVGVKDSGVALTEGTLPLSLNEWFYNPLAKTVYVNVGADPKTHDISLTYMLFYSSAPINMSSDFDSGPVVEWQPYINSIGSIGQQLDDLNTGIVLESSSSIDLINGDGHFDLIYDRYIYENQTIKFYSCIASNTYDVSQIFEGVIESKSFSDTKVTFKVKDFVYKLKNKVELGLFSATDGAILPSILGTPKRRIYGQADYVKAVGTDAILDGYAISGTHTCDIGDNQLVGTSSLYLTELSSGDELTFIFNGEEKKVSIESIQDNTHLTLGGEIDFSLSGLTSTVKPKIPSRYKNRDWHVTGHALRSPSTTITTVIGNNRFEVVSSEDLFAGDAITVNSIPTTIRRISGNEIVTNSAIAPLPSAGDDVTKSPISAVYFKNKRLEHIRDYEIVNTGYAGITLDELAEFNISTQISTTTTMTFTNGSRSITTAATVDLRSILKPRDWIRSSHISKPEWYEIITVNEQEIIIRTAFVGATAAETPYYKNVEYVDDESLITVNCMGMEVDGLWMKTASDAVRHLLLNDAQFPSVNEASFAKAKTDCDYILSYVIPEDIGSQYPVIRDVITQINNSVFGVLYGNSTQSISYSIFNSTKPESVQALQDDDILSFSVQSNQDIINQSKINYRPYTDIFTGDSAFKTVVYDSDFVNNLIGILVTSEQTINLYEDDKALIIAQRLSFFKSLANSTVTIKSKLNLSNTEVNDKLYLSLDRLFRRYGGGERRRIGVVSGVKKDGFGCEISLTDLGNIYNRVMSIAPNDTLDYLSSSEDDIIKWGYVLDNDTETPDPTSEVGLGSNLVG